MIVVVAVGFGIYKLFNPNDDKNTNKTHYAKESLVAKRQNESQKNINKPSIRKKNVKKQAQLRKLATQYAQSVKEDEEFMEHLRQTWFHDPANALEFSQEGEVRFADTPSGAECAGITVRSLWELGKKEEARDKARQLVAKYPDSFWAKDIKRHLLSSQPNN